MHRVEGLSLRKAMVETLREALREARWWWRDGEGRMLCGCFRR